VVGAPRCLALPDQRLPLHDERRGGLRRALAIRLPIFTPDEDLLQAYIADRTVIAEQIQSGKMTIAEGNALITQKWSAVVSEKQRREMARQSVAAQQDAARAAAYQASATANAANEARLRAMTPTTTTCIEGGNYGGGIYSGMTTCNSF